ncbi:MAG: hypothetical protein IKS07_03465, partial [Lachnospiraceae bacterium]|nr:hypothetical protein [Lachnospiraceae bacterium]
MPKNTYQNAEEMNKYRDMKFVLDGQDLKWFEDECARIEKMTGYQLGRRASGTNGLMLYLLAEKDYTLEQLKDLNKLPKEEFKKLAEEFFREVGDPKKTPEENARRSGEIHRKGMEKVLKMKIPTPDLSTREAAGALHEDLLLFQALFFDLSQDTEKLRTTTNGGDPSLVRAYLDGYGGAELLTENDARIHIYRQSVKVIFDILHSGEFREDGQAMALDALRQFFEKFGGKTIGELPRNLHNWMDAAGMAIKTTACPTAKPDAELKNPQAHQDYLEGKAQNYPKQAQFMTALQSVFSGSMESHNGHTRSALNKFSTRSFEGYMNALPNPANPADPADLLQLPEEKLQGLETAYVETFGTCFRDEALEPLADMGLKPWDVIKTPDGKTIHDIVEEKYAGRTNAEKARVMMAETMRTLLSSPEGVRVRIPVMNPKDGSITISGETVVRRLPLSLVQTYTCTPVKKQGNRIITQADAEHFLEAPEGELRNGDPMYFKERINPEVNGVYRFFSNQKPLLEKHGLDVLDCVFVGEKSLKELYHDKYEAMHPNLEGDQLLELMETVLFAESFNPDTPIYLASLSETPEGELRRSVVPVTLRVTGAQTVPGQDRETKADEVRAFGENALKNREQEAYREQSRTELLEREAKRLDGPEGQRRLENEWERRLGILSLRASLITPSSREYLRRTLEVMEPMREQMAETVRQIQLLERAADCTSDEKLRRSMREQAGTLRKNPPVSDYEKLLTGLEYAYGLRGVKSAAEIPMELHQFFEARTGYHIPQFIVESDLSYGAYRPLSVEIPASVFAGEDLKKKLPDYIRRVFLHEVFENANLRPKGLERTDQNDLILIGGKTLSELLKEQGRADAHRVLAQALLDGEPVEFFVGNGWPDRKCSSTPVSIRLEGAPVHVLSREETQQMEAGRQRILDGVKAKGLEIDQTSTEHLRAREQMRNRLAVQQYDGVIATDCCKTTDKGMSSILTVMQIFLFPDGVPKPNPAALDKLKPEERARQIGTIVGGRYSPTSYVIGRLAEESEKLRAQGKPGYTIDQIMDLNSLQEEKRRIAQEYREICESYDTVKYAVGLEQGMRAIVAMHRRAYPPEEIFQSEEMMKKAFLGRAGAFLSNALDSKQELKYEGNKDILVSTGRFKDREEVYAFQDWASDETIMMNVMSQYETAKRYATEKIDSTSSALESEASYGQVIDKIRKDILAGRDPYKGLFLFASSSRGDIVDMDEVQPVLPSLKPYTQKEAPMELVEGLASGKTLETLDLDYEELDRLKEEGKIQAMGEHIRPIARGEKLARDLAPLARVAFHKRVENSMAELRALFVNEQGGLREVSELSEEELGKASQLFDRIYQPYFDSMPVREYLQQNPGKTGMDLILIGSETAASRVELPAELGQAQREMAVKAQLLQFGMDPRMPIYTAGIGYDPKTGSYTLEGARLTMTRNDLRERVIQERPYLASLDTYIGQRILDDPDLSREDFSENEWNEMYEDQFRIAVENGLLPEKRIVHSDQMKAQAEEAGIPSVLHRLQIESLYGAEPTYVPEWCNRTYRRDEFTGLKVQDRGSFTNAQFAVLSYFAVMDPQSVTSDIAPETPNISNERKLRARVMNLTTDLRMDPPRQAFGRNFLRFAEEARDEVARAIQDLEDGQPEHLAGIIARGLKEAIPAIGAISSIQDPSADFACQAEMLKSLNQLLHSADERLSEAVEAQLTEEEKNLIKGILEIKRLMDESSLALKELEEEERGERAPFTEEERAQRR